MQRKIRSYRPSHATLVAYVALFVALGGSSYAAVELNENSVGPSEKANVRLEERVVWPRALVPVGPRLARHRKADRSQSRGRGTGAGRDADAGGASD